MVSAALLAASGLVRGQPGADGGGAVAVPAARQADNVAVITIRRQIDRVSEWSVKRRMRIATDAGADALVFELDTPGGEIGPVLGICTAIKGSKVPNTVAWINDEAYSGGAVIALACREIVTADVVGFGDALPVAVSFGMLNTRLPEAERQKFLAPLLAEVVDSARRRGWDEKLVQGIVSLGVELWLVEHVQTGRRLFIDRNEYRTVFGSEPPDAIPTVVSAAPIESGEGSLASEPPPPAAPTPVPSGSGSSPSEDPVVFRPAAPGLEGLTEAVTDGLEVASPRPVLTTGDRGQWRLVEYVSDGRGLVVLKSSQKLREYGLSAGVVRDDTELRAFLGAKNIRRLEESWSEGLVAFLTNIIVRGVLIAVFLVALFLEMTHPGLILPGAVAACALIALLAPPLLINMAQWWEVAAIAVGILLLVVELFILPGFGVAGILGVLLLFGGLVGTFVPQGAEGLFPDTPEGRNDLLYGVVTIVLSMATAGVGMWYLSRHFGSLPLFGKLVLKSPGIDAPIDDDSGMLAAMAAAPRGPVRPGDVGRAVTPLRPAGKVDFSGRIVDAVADLNYIEPGVPVRASSVSEFRITVEPVAQPPTSRDAGGVTA